MKGNQLTTMMKNQQIQQYIFKAVISKRENPKYQLSPFLAHISKSPQKTDHMGELTDSAVNFPTFFTEEAEKIAEKGSYVRVIVWNIDVKNSRLEVSKIQMLSSPDNKVNRGSRLWNLQRIKSSHEASFVSRDFIVLAKPIVSRTTRAQIRNIFPLTKENLKNIDMSELQLQRNMEIAAKKKTRPNWNGNGTSTQL